VADDKTKQGLDRKFVAGNETYEVRQFADNHDLSIEQAQKLIDQVGNSREALDAAARRFKG
jgi:hypothetical protein